MHEFLNDHVRYLNFFIGVLVVALMTDSSIRRRDKLPRRTRRIWFWFCLWMLNFLYGTASSIGDDIRVNLSTYGSLIILCGLFFSFLWHPEGDTELPPEDKSLSTRFVFWLDQKVRDYKAR